METEEATEDAGSDDGETIEDEADEEEEDDDDDVDSVKGGGWYP